MISRSNLKESLSVDSKHGAFFSSGKVRWSANGFTLYTTDIKVINVIDYETGKTKLILGDQSEDSDNIHCFAVKPDDTQLVSAHKSGLLKCWQLSDGKLIKQWKSIHRGPIAELDISNESLLASGGSDSVIRIWNLIHHSCTHALKGAIGVISIVKFQVLNEKKVVFGCGDDLKINCWDLGTNEMLFQLSGHYSKVTSITFDIDNKHLVSSARDNVLILWDLEKKVSVKTFPMFESVEEVVYLPQFLELPVEGVLQGGILIATAGSKGIIRILNISTGKELYSQADSLVSKSVENENLLITQLMYNKLRHCFCMVTVDHNILFYKADTFECIKQMVGFSDEILDIVFLGQNNSHVAVGTNSCDIKVYNIKKMDCQLLKGHTDLVIALTYSLANCYWMLSGAKDNSVRLWELNPNNQKILCLATGSRHTGAVSSLCMSQMTTEFFFSSSQDTTLKLWKINVNKKKSVEIEYQLLVKNTEVAHQKDINSIAISPNDKLVASASQDKTIKLWQVENLVCLGTLNGHKRGVWCVRFSPVDQILLSSSADSTIKIWSITDLNCLKTFEGHDSSVLRAEFLTKGMQILSTSGDGLLKLWNVKSGECISTFNEHDGRIWALAVSIDENHFVTGGSDSLLVIWRDSTEEKREAAVKIQEEIISNEQKLSNLLNNNQLFAALGLALALDKPFKVLSIIRDIMKKKQQADLKKTLKELTDCEKEKLLECASTWNSNSKNCDAAQLVISFFLEEIVCGKLKLTKLPEMIEEIIPYTERHFKRLTGLLQDLHFLDYTLEIMKPEAK